MTASFEIELATTSDAATVAKLVDAAYSKWIPILGRKPTPMTANYEDLIALDRVYKVCEGIELIGVCVIWTEKDALYIDNLAVHPDHQGRGIGDSMLQFAELKARERDLNRLTLVTNEKMEYNQIYYRKHGFNELRRDPLPDGGRVVWMYKEL